MLHFAIVDDCPNDAAFVTGLIENWNQEKKLLLEIRQFSSAEAFLFAFEEDGAFDVLFLDIEMDGMSGLELAKRLREKGATLPLVFITGYMEYIAQGYDVAALHYLLKPVTGEKLGEVLNRCLERIKARERELLLELADGTVRLPLSEIQYIEVLKNYVTVHAGEDYRVKRTLSQLEKGLDESFFKVHRSYIVSLRFIKRITKTEVILKNGLSIPLSRKLYEDLNRAMIKYF